MTMLHGMDPNCSIYTILTIRYRYSTLDHRGDYILHLLSWCCRNKAWGAWTRPRVDPAGLLVADMPRHAQPGHATFAPDESDDAEELGLGGVRALSKQSSTGSLPGPVQRWLKRMPTCGRLGGASFGSQGSRNPTSFRKPTGNALANGVRKLKLYTAEDQRHKIEERKSKRAMTRGRRGAAQFASRASFVFSSTGLRPRSAAAAALLALRIRGEHLTLRQRAFLILEEPESSTKALMVSLVVRAVTLLASASSVFVSLDWLVDETGPQPWVFANNVFFAFFLIEAITVREPLLRSRRGRARPDGSPDRLT